MDRIPLTLFLKHLIYEGTIPVLEEIPNGLPRVAFRETEDKINALILAGRVDPRGTRRRVHALYWIGPRLTAKEAPELAEFVAGGKDIRHKTKYSHNWDTHWNPKNVWFHDLGGIDPAAHTIPRDLQAIFLAVALSVGGVQTILKGKRR